MPGGPGQPSGLVGRRSSVRGFSGVSLPLTNRLRGVCSYARMAAKSFPRVNLVIPGLSEPSLASDCRRLILRFWPPAL
jgi:hypothetical protein